MKRKRFIYREPIKETKGETLLKILVLLIFCLVFAFIFLGSALGF